MLENESSTGDFWCPLDARRDAPAVNPAFDMTPADWAALSRFSRGEWVSDAQTDRLQALGLVERVFGQPLLTRLGRTTIGVGE